MSHDRDKSRLRRNKARIPEVLWRDRDPRHESRAAVTAATAVGAQYRSMVALPARTNSERTPSSRMFGSIGSFEASAAVRSCRTKAPVADGN
jgi:hypothetical protein